jgi:hypothetical protein
LPDRFNLDHAEGRAWAKRTDAFGTVAKLGGLLNRTGSEDYQCIYGSSDLSVGEAGQHRAC